MVAAPLSSSEAVPRRRWVRRIGIAATAILAVFLLPPLMVEVAVRVLPRNTAAPKIRCANNLRNIGGMLVERAASKKEWKRNGAALLLQTYTNGMIRRGEEGVFLCPHDPRRKELESEEFRAGFRSIDLRAPAPGLTSYLGRDFERFPLSDEPSRRKAALALCPHHEGGVNVLYDDGSVVFLDREDLGLTPGEPIVVGPESKADLLRMFVAPPR